MASPGFLCAISRPKDSNVDADSFQYECREAHKSRREFLQGGNVEILSHEHFLAKKEEPGVRSCMDVYELSDIEPLLSGNVLLEEGGDGPLETHTYTYKLLSSHGTTAAHSSQSPSDLVMTSCDPPVSHLDELNRWYEQEYIPSLQKIPDWQSTVRGKMLLLSRDADDTLPKYVALHRYGPVKGCSSNEESRAAASNTTWSDTLWGVIGRDGRFEGTEWLFQQT